MQYLEMRPHQIREAIEKNTPVIIPVGVIEYHGEHLPLGVDTFVAIENIKRVETKHPDLIVMPPFYYGTASYAVAAPEKNGTVSCDSKRVMEMAEEIFYGLLRVGFRNIHVTLAHQTEEFEQGMPTDLAFRFAARRAIFRWLDKDPGEGWWGTEKFADYYSGDNNPFAWIQVHPPRALTPEIAAQFPGDHAGKQETSETLWMYPQCVDMDRIDDNLWYCREAHGATKEHGDANLQATADELETHLYPKKD